MGIPRLRLLSEWWLWSCAINRYLIGIIWAAVTYGIKLDATSSFNRGSFDVRRGDDCANYNGVALKYFTVPMRFATRIVGTAKAIGALPYKHGLKLDKLTIMIMEPDGSIWYWPIDQGAFPTFNRLGKIE